MKIKAKLNYIGVGNPPAKSVIVTFKEEDLKLYRGVVELLQDTYRSFLAIDAVWFELDFEGFVIRDDNIDHPKEKVKQDNLLIYKDGLVRYWIDFEAGGSAYADLLNLNEVTLQEKHED